MSWIIADAHVHLPSVEHLASLATSARRNFLRAERRHRLADAVSRCLFLADLRDGTTFAQIRSLAEERRTPSDAFALHPTREAQAVRLAFHDGCALVLIAARQIVTAEAIEVLAIGLTRPYGDGRPLGMVLEELSREDLLLILPWGVGKWLGQRGRIIADAVDGWRGDQLFLGDNGNRPFFWPLPPVFAAGQRGRCRNLPGSDPLPLAGEEGQAGRCGFWCEGVVDADRPFASVAALLRDPVTALHPYGAGETAYRFCRNQLLLRLAR